MKRNLLTDWQQADGEEWKKHKNEIEWVVRVRVNSIHELPQVLTVAIMTILCHSRCVRDDVFHSIAYICAKVVSSTMSQSTTSMVTEHTHTHTKRGKREMERKKLSSSLSPNCATKQPRKCHFRKSANKRDNEFFCTFITSNVIQVLCRFCPKKCLLCRYFICVL